MPAHTPALRRLLTVSALVSVVSCGLWIGRMFSVVELRGLGTLVGIGVFLGWTCWAPALVALLAFLLERRPTLAATLPHAFAKVGALAGAAFPMSALVIFITLDPESWTDASGIVFLFMPIYAVALGAVGTILGAVGGWWIGRGWSARSDLT